MESKGEIRILRPNSVSFSVCLQMKSYRVFPAQRTKNDIPDCLPFLFPRPDKCCEKKILPFLSDLHVVFLCHMWNLTTNDFQSKVSHIIFSQYIKSTDNDNPTWQICLGSSFRQWIYTNNKSVGQLLNHKLQLQFFNALKSSLRNCYRLQNLKSWVFCVL